MSNLKLPRILMCIVPLFFAQSCREKSTPEFMLHSTTSKKWNLVQYNETNIDQINRVWEFRKDGLMFHFKINPQSKLEREDFGDQVFSDEYSLKTINNELFIDMKASLFSVEKLTTDTLILRREELYYVFTPR